MKISIILIYYNLLKSFPSPVICKLMYTVKITIKMYDKYDSMFSGCQFDDKLYHCSIINTDIKHDISRILAIPLFTKIWLSKRTYLLIEDCDLSLCIDYANHIYNEINKMRRDSELKFKSLYAAAKEMAEKIDFNLAPPRNVGIQKNRDNYEGGPEEYFGRSVNTFAKEWPNDIKGSTDDFIAEMTMWHRHCLNMSKDKRPKTFIETQQLLKIYLCNKTGEERLKRLMLSNLYRDVSLIQMSAYGEGTTEEPGEVLPITRDYTKK
ncbi:hypothetical protein QTP88_015081 [Uroleucon formosanum]